MMRFFGLAIGTALLGAVATPAIAQEIERGEFGEEQMIGTRFEREPETADAAEARWMQKRVANCTFNRNREESVELLANSNFYQIHFDALSYSDEEFWDDFEINYCIGRLMRGADNRNLSMYMQIQFSTLRNLLAEEAYLRANDDPVVIAPGEPQDIAARFDGQRVHPQISTMAGLADCVVYNAPDTAHELLESRPGSGDEGEVVDALGPTIAACAGSDETMTISSSLVRQMVADGLWSRSYYSAAAGSGE
ncbi:hypothetical protein [Aurantiacibacter sp. MUD61]|uniref:hypothetical protein n=1 Tax=Aurantiacibacter sp. MUD61 TaxID=3009083 RepID=UPI0022F0772C|nr:hypothetical protein [Aurantiacibacter sp. MUD61]